MRQLTSVALLSALLFSASCMAQEFAPIVLDPELIIYLDKSKEPFYHGVASGDPLPTAVILWTRVTPSNAHMKRHKNSLCSADVLSTEPTVEVVWQIALDTTFEHTIQNGTVYTNENRDYTVKLDVQNLEPSTTYYYRFFAFNKSSDIGRTKTAELQTNQTPNGALRFAIVSCNNYQDGFFNAFRLIGQADTLDAVVHLGDYIYEYGTNKRYNKKCQRRHVPTHEITSLQDYRTRHSQYRLDPDLQFAHQMHPFICIWDDHEVANDSYCEGAENHSDKIDGDFCERSNEARRAYYEWLPVREASHLYRSYSFGALADIHLLDERLEGREKPAKSKKALKNEPNHTMLGKEQADWLKQELVTSTGRWQIIGNQVLFSQLNVCPLFPHAFVNFDAWDGYPAERQSILQTISDHNIARVIIVTGDTHSSWSFDISKNQRIKNAQNLLIQEFATPSISSCNMDEYTNRFTTKLIERLIKWPGVNEGMQHANLRDHGFLVLKLTHDYAESNWVYMQDLLNRNTKYVNGPHIRVQAKDTLLNKHEQHPPIIAQMHNGAKPIAVEK